MRIAWKAHILFMNYDTIVPWDLNLIDVWYTDIDNPLVKGLVRFGTYIATGAPAATVGYFIPGAIVSNAVDATAYINVGTTAAPVWEVLQTAPAVETFRIAFAGTLSGQTTATRAYTVTAAAASDVATAVIRASQNAVTIQKVTVSTNTITILFSGDPGTGTTIDYTLVRAA